MRQVPRASVFEYTFWILPSGRAYGLNLEQASQDPLNKLKAPCVAVLVLIRLIANLLSREAFAANGFAAVLKLRLFVFFGVASA